MNVDKHGNRRYCFIGKLKKNETSINKHGTFIITQIIIYMVDI